MPIHMSWPCPHLTVSQAWEFVHAAEKNVDEELLVLKNWSEQAQIELAALSDWGNHGGQADFQSISKDCSLEDKPEWDNIGVREALRRLGQAPFQLDTRAPNFVSPGFAQKHPPGLTLRTTIEHNSLASLRHGDVEILVRVLDIRDSDFSGAIHGFENNGNAEYNSLAEGDPIEFHESEVFACHLD